MKIGIVGYGHVGKAMHKLFDSTIIYDKNKNIGSRNLINECEVAFVCVPTPMMKDGDCDTTMVEEVINWCLSKLIVLRSTVRVGFTKQMVEKYNKKIVFQPEYYGETINHPFANLSERTWLSFGGEKEPVNLAINAYHTVVNSNVQIFIGTSDEVEMAKYMENAFLATKVIFCNEMYDICEAMNIDFNVVREIWTADPRIGKSHTFVYPYNRGFSGKCLPKDISSIRKQGKDFNTDTTLLDSVIKKNKKYLNKKSNF